MKTLSQIEELFENNLRSVDELISFDKIILDVCIGHIEKLNNNLKNGPFKISNPFYLAENTLVAIKNIRQNNSLRHNYKSMFNSCLVLQVSFFTLIVDDIFRHTSSRLFKSNLRPDLDFELLRKKNDINFQNMGSIERTYRNYLDIPIERNSVCNTIILAQCCRHSLVHNLGVADEKFINQVNAAKPRDIKHNFFLEDKIQFSDSELNFIKIAMQLFISELCDKIRLKYSIE